MKMFIKKAIVFCGIASMVYAQPAQAGWIPSWLSYSSAKEYVTQTLPTNVKRNVKKLASSPVSFVKEKWNAPDKTQRIINRTLLTTSAIGLTSLAACVVAKKTGLWDRIAKSSLAKKVSRTWNKFFGKKTSIQANTNPQQKNTQEEENQSNHLDLTSVQTQERIHHEQIQNINTEHNQTDSIEPSTNNVQIQKAPEQEITLHNTQNIEITCDEDVLNALNLKPNPTTYDILGLNNNASTREINKNFKNLSLKYHPDRNDQSELSKKIFLTINTAKDIALKKEQQNNTVLPIEFKANQLNTHKEKIAQKPNNSSYKHMENAAIELQEITKKNEAVEKYKDQLKNNAEDLYSDSDDEESTKHTNGENVNEKDEEDDWENFLDEFENISSINKKAILPLEKLKKLSPYTAQINSYKKLEKKKNYTKIPEDVLYTSVQRGFANLYKVLNGENIEAETQEEYMTQILDTMRALQVKAIEEGLTEGGPEECAFILEDHDQKLKKWLIDDYKSFIDKDNGITTNNKKLYIYPRISSHLKQVKKQENMWVFNLPLVKNIFQISGLKKIKEAFAHPTHWGIDVRLTSNPKESQPLLLTNKRTLLLIDYKQDGKNYLYIKPENYGLNDGFTQHAKEFIEAQARKINWIQKALGLESDDSAANNKERMPKDIKALYKELTNTIKSIKTSDAKSIKEALDNAWGIVNSTKTKENEKKHAKTFILSLENLYENPENRIGNEISFTKEKVQPWAEYYTYIHESNKEAKNVELCLEILSTVRNDITKIKKAEKLQLTENEINNTISKIAMSMQKFNQHYTNATKVDADFLKNNKFTKKYLDKINETFAYIVKYKELQTIDNLKKNDLLSVKRCDIRTQGRFKDAMQKVADKTKQNLESIIQYGEDEMEKISQEEAQQHKAIQKNNFDKTNELIKKTFDEATGLRKVTELRQLLPGDSFSDIKKKINSLYKKINTTSIDHHQKIEMLCNMLLEKWVKLHENICQSAQQNNIVFTQDPKNKAFIRKHLEIINNKIKELPQEKQSDYKPILISFTHQWGFFSNTNELKKNLQQQQKNTINSIKQYKKNLGLMKSVYTSQSPESPTILENHF